MKKGKIQILSVILSILITSCSGTAEDSNHQQGLNARSRYLSMTKATGICTITADYGQRVYDFDMVLNISQEEGGYHTELTLIAPEEVAGIQVTQVGLGADSKLIWDDMILETGDLSDNGLSPVTAVPLLLETLCQGYMETITLKEKSGGTVLELYCRDPDVPLGLGQEIILWVDAQSYDLVGGEIFQDGARVIGCQVQQFVMN